MDIMFDQQYLVMGDEVPIKLGFKDVIFVMEDVDAASKVRWIPPSHPNHPHLTPPKPHMNHYHPTYPK